MDYGAVVFQYLDTRTVHLDVNVPGSMSWEFWGIQLVAMTMQEDEDLPDSSLAKEFYAKYEVREVLGKYVWA